MDDHSQGGTAYMPGAASLIEQLDKRVMIILRDGRHLVGKLRSFDHFMNLILEETCERVLLTGKYCDVPLGLYVIRGDSVVLMGEIDSEREGQMKLEKLTPREFAELPEAQPDKIAWDFEA